MRRRHEAGVRAQHVLAVFGQLDLGTGGNPGLQRSGRPAVRNEHGCDLPPVAGPREVGDERRQDRGARDLPRVAVVRIRHVDVGRVVGMRIEREARAVRRPLRVGYARAAGNVHRHLRTVARGDHIDPHVRPDREVPVTVRLGVDEEATQLVERPAEPVHRHRSVADLVEEPPLVGTHVGKRHVEVAGRQHRPGKLARRFNPFLSSENRLGVRRVLAQRSNRSQERHHDEQRDAQIQPTNIAGHSPASTNPNSDWWTVSDVGSTPRGPRRPFRQGRTTRNSDAIARSPNEAGRDASDLECHQTSDTVH